MFSKISIITIHIISHFTVSDESVKMKHCVILKMFFSLTSRKWLTVAIFQKWQDSTVALWIKIAVILNWR